MSTWNERTTHTETRQVTGTGTLSATISGAPVEEATDWSLGLHAQQLVIINLPTGHGFAAGSHLYIDGTTNYDGVKEVTDATSSGITIKVDKFIAETPAGTETVGFVVAPNQPFILREINLNLDTAPTTSENFVCTLDANRGANWDRIIFSQDVATYTDISETKMNIDFMRGDKLRFTLPNTDGRTYSLDVKYRIKG